MPAPLPLPMIATHRLLMLANSAGLSVDGVNGNSVTASGRGGRLWIVVLQAAMPRASGKAALPAAAALFEQLVPDPPLPARVETSFTTMEGGTTPVSVLLVRSLATNKLARPFGVIRQEQQEISCSSGLNAYTLTQRFPDAAPMPGPFSREPFAPVLVMKICDDIAAAPDGVMLSVAIDPVLMA